MTNDYWNQPQAVTPGYIYLLGWVGERMPDTATQLADIISRRDKYIDEQRATIEALRQHLASAERRFRWATVAAGVASGCCALAFWLAAAGLR